MIQATNHGTACPSHQITIHTEPPPSVRTHATLSTESDAFFTGDEGAFPMPLFLAPGRACAVLCGTIHLDLHLDHVLAMKICGLLDSLVCEPHGYSFVLSSREQHTISLHYGSGSLPIKVELLSFYCLQLHLCLR